MKLYKNQNIDISYITKIIVKLTLTHGDLNMCMEATITNMIDRRPILLGTLEEGHLLPAVSPCQPEVSHLPAMEEDTPSKDLPWKKIHHQRTGAV